MNKAWETLVGLEVHAELCTEKKLFCNCDKVFGAPPNTLCCPVCCGKANAVPTLNRQAVHFAVRLGLALGCKINMVSHFDRKYYQYPDLPKGYQITQHCKPICEEGRLLYWLEGVAMNTKIERIQLEEDTAKITHDSTGKLKIDHNRCGVPLVEIITSPQIQSGRQAKAFLEALAATLLAVEVCDGKGQEGSLRADVNISVRPVGQVGLSPRGELKNISGFSTVARAVEAEAKRQIALYQAGKVFLPETRHWDDKNRKSTPLRSKESEMSYQYMAESQLPPLYISKKDLQEQKNNLPELPWQKQKRYSEEYDLPFSSALLLAKQKDLSLFFELANEYNYCKARRLSNMILGDFTALMRKYNTTLEEQATTPKQLSKLVGLIENGTVSALVAKDLLADMIQTGASAEELAKKQGVLQISKRSYLEEVVRCVLKENPQAIHDYNSDKKAVLGFLVGQGMKKSKSQANPVLLQELFAKYLAAEDVQGALW